jgi:hypothetical protein
MARRFEDFENGSERVVEVDSRFCDRLRHVGRCGEVKNNGPIVEKPREQPGRGHVAANEPLRGVGKRSAINTENLPSVAIEMADERLAYEAACAGHDRSPHVSSCESRFRPRSRRR